MAKAAVVSAKTVRAWFAENPTLVPEGDKSLTGRGRVSAAVRKVFNEKSGMTIGDEKFVATVPLAYTHVQPSGKKVAKVAQVTPAELRALGNVPKHGRINDAVVEAAGKAYAAQVQAARAQA